MSEERVNVTFDYVAKDGSNRSFGISLSFFENSTFADLTEAALDAVGVWAREHDVVKIIAIRAQIFLIISPDGAGTRRKGMNIKEGREALARAAQRTFQKLAQSRS